MNDNQKRLASLDDSILNMSREQVAERYRQLTGHDPEPLTEAEKKEYGLK